MTCIKCEIISNKWLKRCPHTDENKINVNSFVTCKERLNCFEYSLIWPLLNAFILFGQALYPYSSTCLMVARTVLAVTSSMGDWRVPAQCFANMYGHISGPVTLHLKKKQFVSVVQSLY